ncbi:MAG: ABC transporter substrate-binding protein [Gammaproteobacteria bacterium]|nr:ABC transporter substrate-binding protein [Gammaproteobacteria bacterium]
MTIPASAATSTVEPGVLQVGTDLTYPPYNYFDDNKQPAGFDFELVTALAKIAGLKVKVLDTRFENLIIGVKGNKFDVIASTLYVKSDRALQINFIPYMKTGVSIAVSKTSSFKPVEPEELCGKKVASIKGAAWIADLKKLSETGCVGRGTIDVREFPTSPEATQAVMSGGVDVQLEDSAVLWDAVRKTNGRVVISSNRNLYPVVVGLGLNKQNKELLDTLQTALNKFRASGGYQKLLKKYNVSAPAAYEFEVAVMADADKQKDATMTRCLKMMSKLHSSENEAAIKARCVEMMR